MKVFRAMLLMLLVTAVPAASLAQSATGAILGDIVDATGARLPGVTVKLVNQQTGATRELVSSELGSYRFNALPPAVYTVTVEFAGFKTVSAKNITVPNTI